MTVRLSAVGVEDTLTGAGIRWDALASVHASNVDHMTQRVAMLAFAATDGSEIETYEGSAGWDVLVTGLAEHVALAVADLDAAVSMLRSGQTLRVFPA